MLKVDLDYLFVAQCIVEEQYIVDENKYLMMVAISYGDRDLHGGQLTASQVKDKAVLSQCVHKDQVYTAL